MVRRRSTHSFARESFTLRQHPPTLHFTTQYCDRVLVRAHSINTVVALSDRAHSLLRLRLRAGANTHTHDQRVNAHRRASQSTLVRLRDNSTHAVSSTFDLRYLHIQTNAPDFVHSQIRHTNHAHCPRHKRAFYNPHFGPSRAVTHTHTHTNFSGSSTGNEIPRRRARRAKYVRCVCELVC